MTAVFQFAFLQATSATHIIDERCDTITARGRRYKARDYARTSDLDDEKLSKTTCLKLFEVL